MAKLLPLALKAHSRRAPATAVPDMAEKETCEQVRPCAVCGNGARGVWRLERLRVAVAQSSSGGKRSDSSVRRTFALASAMQLGSRCASVCRVAQSECYACHPSALRVRACWRRRKAQNVACVKEESKRKVVCDARCKTPTLQNELFRLFLHNQARNRNKSSM